MNAVYKVHSTKSIKPERCKSETDAMLKQDYEKFLDIHASTHASCVILASLPSGVFTFYLILVQRLLQYLVMLLRLVYKCEPCFITLSFKQTVLWKLDNSIKVSFCYYREDGNMLFWIKDEYWYRWIDEIYPPSVQSGWCANNLSNYCSRSFFWLKIVISVI